MRAFLERNSTRRIFTVRILISLICLLLLLSLPVTSKTNKTGQLIKPKPAPIESVWTPYKLETTNNTLNFAQFPDAQLPPHHFSILGYGFPSFSNEMRNPILKVLTIGHTHLSNNSAFPDEATRPSAHYSFESVPAMASDAADKIIQEGKYKEIYGNLAGIASRKQDINGITREGALELGKYMFYARSHSWSPNQQSWSRPTNNGAWIMMDEEEYPWKSDKASLFASWLMEGHAEVAPDKKIGFYGHPVTWRMHRPYQDMTNTELEEFLRTEQTPFDTPSWKKAAPYIDLSPGYFKIPYLEKNSLYKKNASGQYLKDKNGARIWRDDNFTEVIFGHTNHIWAEPEADLRNFQRNDQGHAKCAPELEPGWHWDSWCGHERNPQWLPEVKMMVEGIYRYADYILVSKLLLSKANFGDRDISYWRPAKLKTYVERRPRTEPWTWGGNTRWIREIGETGLKYQVMFAFLSGIQAVSTWDNGGILFKETDLKPYGENVYAQGEFLPSIGENDSTTPQPDNYSRYVVWTAAVNTFARLMKGIPVDESMKYVRFYYPIAGSRNKEVISTGIYSGKRLIVMFNYPLLDPDEKLLLRITAGSVQYDAVIRGREVLLLNISVPAKLLPQDFTLSYRNINGKLFHVNGFVGEKVADHYLN